MLLHGIDCDGQAHHFPGDPAEPIIGSCCYCGDLEWYRRDDGSAHVRVVEGRSWWTRHADAAPLIPLAAAIVLSILG